MGKQRSIKTSHAAIAPIERRLHDDIAGFIQESLERVSAGIHAEMVNLYWQIGNRIRKDILEEKRAEYSKQILQNLARQLALEYGQGYSRRNLFNMVRFAEVFPSSEILSTVANVLTWSHLCILIYMDDELQRDFYVQMCRIEKWSVRTLQQKINGMLFERTVHSKERFVLFPELWEVTSFFMGGYYSPGMGISHTPDIRPDFGFLYELGIGKNFFLARHKKEIINNFIPFIEYHVEKVKSERPQVFEQFPEYKKKISDFVMSATEICKEPDAPDSYSTYYLFVDNKW